MQNLLCRSPIPKMVYVNPTMGGEVDSASFLQAFFKMFIYKPNLLLAMSSPHVVGAGENGEGLMKIAGNRRNDERTNRQQHGHGFSPR